MLAFINYYIEGPKASFLDPRAPRRQFPAAVFFRVRPLHTPKAGGCVFRLITNGLILRRLWRERRLLPLLFPQNGPRQSFCYILSGVSYGSAAVCV